MLGTADRAMTDDQVDALVTPRHRNDDERLRIRAAWGERAGRTAYAPGRPRVIAVAWDVTPGKLLSHPWLLLILWPTCSRRTQDNASCPRAARASNTRNVGTYARAYAKACAHE